MKFRMTYSLMDEIMASKNSPLPEFKIRHQLSRMHQGLHALETAEKPTMDDWQVVSDAINMIETLTLTNNGWWSDCDGDQVQITDSNGLLQDAVSAMAQAGRRYYEHGVIRLDAKGIATIRAVLEDYSQLIQVLPARVMIHCHRKTEIKLHDILKGQAKPHDVVVNKRQKT
jgi:hypothetical protein